MSENTTFRTRWGMVLAIGLAILLAGCTQQADQEAELSSEERHAEIMDHAEEVSSGIDTVEEAREAGYEPDRFCVPGMGVHWLHQPGQEGSSLDAELSEDEPEAILFEPENENFTDPDANRFVGIEYIVFTEGTDMNSTDTKPDFMGAEMEGPMPGHTPEMPWHVDFHVYLAEDVRSTPDFEPTNPSITCPEGTTPPGER